MFNPTWRRALAAGALALASSPAFAAHWALSGDVGVHDPSVIREGSHWYTFSTGEGLQVLQGDATGRQWTRVPRIFLSAPSWWRTYVPNHRNNDVWAPDVHQYNGKVWLYYAISTFGSNTSAIGLVSASRISDGRWTDHGLVLRTTSGNDYNAIDPHLVVDAAGEPWLAFGSFWSGLKIVRLNKSTMKPTGGHVSIAKRSGGIEAPAITYANGWYHLFASIDKCCAGVNSTYKIIHGRSRSISGPYLDRNGRSLLNGGGTVFDAGNARWKGPGGQDVGDGVLARHAYDAQDNGVPKLLISDLKWTADGWPTY
ncbi:MAG: glycoside hydrolase family 43 protein [Rhizobacter sp.]